MARPLREPSSTERLREANPHFEGEVGEIRPDGDVVLSDEAVADFHPPRCLVCASDLVKPDVVFFGESVPKPIKRNSVARGERQNNRQTMRRCRRWISHQSKR